MFRQLGFRLRKPGSAIGQADPERQKAQKNSQACGKMPAVYHWATDEVHFEQRGSRCRMGVPPWMTCRPSASNRVRLSGSRKPIGRQCLHHRYFPVLEEVVEAQLENWRRETKPYLDYAQTRKTLCLTFNQNRLGTAGRAVMFCLRWATRRQQIHWLVQSVPASWCSQRNHPGIESSSFLLRCLNVRGLKPCPGMAWNDGQVGRCRQPAAHDLRSWRPTRHARSNGPRRCGYVLSDRRE